MRCFYLASGLKIILQKSKLIVVGLSNHHVELVARNLGCAPDCLPFVHLGVPVGQCMSRVSAWSPIVDRFRPKLLGWKVKSLSFGGRLTLIKFVLRCLGSYLMSIFMVPTLVLKSLETLCSRFFWGAELDDRCIHWVQWDKVLVARKEGGLGVGSLFSFNRAMIYRWWWRFYQSSDLLWVIVIKAIYGSNVLVGT